MPAVSAKLEKEIEDFTEEPYDPCKAYQVVALSPDNSLNGPRALYRSHNDKTWGTDLFHRLASSRPAPVKDKR